MRFRKPNQLAQNLPNLEKIQIHLEKIWTDLTKRVLQHANKLSEFHIHGDFAYQFDEHDYNEILQVILAREQCTKLTMTLEYSCFTHMRIDWHRKFKVLNRNSNLTICMYYTQQNY